ncbi:HAMP domain-containing protein [Sphingobacterium sp. N143]|uniref:HAMP domain-containing sensor histidine kinase n=1 Tax=Sphingobacterium sp. N143 TaxID=2746727 RepID=UPI0025774ADF|nr:ATP-binding protein [Sphingobacterium sp. N143]MDM1292747.1 HAMP domain-containing protein [Sphingobacterium sp. N143]
MHNYNRKLIYLIAILIVYVSCFVGFIFYSITNFAFTDFYKRLDLRRNIAAEKFLNNQLANQTDQWSLDFIENLNNQHEFLVEFDQHGNILRSQGLHAELWDRINKTGTSNFKAGNQFYSTKYFTKDNKHYIVGASAENYFYTHHLRYLRNLLIISFILGVLFILVVSVFMKRSFLKPILTMMKEVQEIGSENLDKRLDEDKYKGDLQDLALTFNGMLTRLETSFETQKNFISNASHELNTPLTSIIGQADLALSKERTKEEYQRTLLKIIESAEHLEKKTRALLLLARTGFVNNSTMLNPVRIDQIIMDAELTVKAINDKFKIVTDFSLLPDDSMRLKINGNAILLQLALSNIISNACKYSSDRTAYIALGALDNKVFILIKDKGIGIPSKELGHIYDPYFRASNTSGIDGYGIGLPLARNIIKLHGGILKVNSIVGEGTTVEIELPTYLRF